MTTFDEALEDGSGLETVTLEGANAQDEAPAQSGQDGVEGSSTEDGTAPSYFDLDQYGDQIVKVKVDGEEQDVPLAELRNGYMRQEAFTQKTQALAEERQSLEGARALAQAYQANPQDTVRFLAEQNGITLAQATAVAEQAEQESWTDTGAQDDPRLAAIEQRFAELDQREARMELERTLDDLGNRYGDDFKANDVISRAIELQTDNLEGVYKEMAFDRMMARQDAERTAEANTQQNEDAATAAKRELVGAVASGGSFGGAGDASSAPVQSVSDALDSAMAEFGDLW